MHPNENCNCRYADVGCDKMEEVMDQISGKWKMRILFMVGAHGTLRYGELRRLLDGRDPQDALKPVKGAGRRWAGGAHRLWRGPAPGRLPPDPERRGIDADF